jgi:hypothetical protein
VTSARLRQDKFMLRVAEAKPMSHKDRAAPVAVISFVVASLCPEWTGQAAHSEQTFRPRDVASLVTSPE